MKKLKPIKAWVRVGENWKVVDSTLAPNTVVLFTKRPRKELSVVKVIRVLITPL